MSVLRFLNTLFTQKKVKKTTKKKAKKINKKTKRAVFKKIKIRRPEKKKAARRKKVLPGEKTKGAKRKSAARASGKKIKKPRPCTKKIKKPKEKEAGVITHYFGKISVGIILLKTELKLGDKIHIKGRQSDFTQTVRSLQFNHQDIPSGKKGMEVGIKVVQRVHEGDRAYRLR